MRVPLRLATPPPAAGSARTELSIRLALADDHAAARRSLRRLIDAEADFELVAEAAELSTVARQVHAHVPQVLVLGLHIPRGSSIEMIRGLREQTPETEIVVLTMEASPVVARRAIDAGAMGFVLTDKADTELPAAVRSAARRREYISAHVAAGVNTLRHAGRGDGLSLRETEVLRLIALGHTSAEIGAELRLSRRTIETYRARILQTLGLSTRADLVRFALQRHLIGS